MRFIAWPALVASLTLVIFQMGYPAITIDKNIPEDDSSSFKSYDSPVKQSPPGNANYGGKVYSFPDVESDHSGINEKVRG
jgi:hypothetical protein